MTNDLVDRLRRTEHLAEHGAAKPAHVDGLGGIGV
jgi:hypothetical protein